MKSIIFYSSDYKKNTERIAEIMADEISAVLVNIRDMKDSVIEIDHFDLIGFGSGVYRESLSPKISKFAEKLNLVEKNVFVFSTSGVGLKFYNDKLIKDLESKGAKNRGSFASKGYFVATEFTQNKIFNLVSGVSKGHPNERDFAKARKFITHVSDSLKIEKPGI